MKGRGRARWRAQLDRYRGAVRGLSTDTPVAPGPPSADDAAEEPPVSELLMPGMLEMLDDRDLCVLWRRCQHEVETATSSRRRDEHERLRDDCIAELERRHPDAIAAWLAEGAGTAEGLESLVAPDAEQTSQDSS